MAEQTKPTTFADLQFGPRGSLDGIQARASFPNGYGASVIRGYGTYGADSGLYELGVTHGKALCYDTPVTDDVLGYLTEQDVTDALAKIAALPPREPRH